MGGEVQSYLSALDKCVGIEMVFGHPLMSMEDCNSEKIIQCEPEEVHPRTPPIKRWTNVQESEET